MAGEANFLEFIVNKFAWLVVIALYFVYYYLHFFIHLFLKESAVQCDIHQEVDGLGQMLFQDGAVEYRFLFACISVQVTANRFQAVDNLTGRASLCSFEVHVLHEMSHTALECLLVSCACINGYAAINHLSRTGSADDA